MTKNLHRKLTPEEIKEYQDWAEDNWAYGRKIDPMWHPVVRQHCRYLGKKELLEKLKRKGNSMSTYDWCDIMGLPFEMFLRYSQSGDAAVQTFNQDVMNRIREHLEEYKNDALSRLNEVDRLRMKRNELIKEVAFKLTALRDTIDSIQARTGDADHEIWDHLIYHDVDGETFENFVETIRSLNLKINGKTK
jgi:hypothetical protein